jgi:hypothetical protein
MGAMTQNYRTENPYAPPAYQGTPNGAPEGFVDVGFDYIYNNPVALPAVAILSGQAIPLDSDSDFVWRAVFISNVNVRLRFQDANGYYLSNDYIMAANLDTVVFPELLFPAGGRIGIDFTELTAGAGIPVLQIVCRGARRYRVAR